MLVQDDGNTGVLLERGGAQLGGCSSEGCDFGCPQRTSVEHPHFANGLDRLCQHRTFAKHTVPTEALNPGKILPIADLTRTCFQASSAAARR